MKHDLRSLSSVAKRYLRCHFLLIAVLLLGCSESTSRNSFTDNQDPLQQFMDAIAENGMQEACQFINDLCQVAGGKACNIYQMHCSGVEPENEALPPDSSGSDESQNNPPLDQPSPAPEGAPNNDANQNSDPCFEPQFHYATINEWWREFECNMPLASLQLQIQNGVTYDMSYQWNKWIHGDSVSIPAGTQVRLLAKSPSGESGQTAWFALQSENPQTISCSASQGNLPPPDSEPNPSDEPAPSDENPGAPSGDNPANSPVARYGKLAVSGAHIVDQSGNPVQLRGMSFGWSNWWGQYFTAEVVSWLIDDWKVQLVRAAMGIEPAGAYLQNPATEKNKVITVVDEAIRRGIYVIIDWHDHNAPNNVKAAEAFFEEMATRYHNYPNVIYELFNEPEGETWPQIKSYAQRVIAKIRAQDPSNLIIVGTPNWSQDVDQAAKAPLAGKNIAYTLHFYAASHKQWLRDKAQAAMAAGIALFVTEWGVCEASGSGYLDQAETETWLKFMDQNKLSWANWDIADKAGETCSALLPNSSPTGAWPESSLNASGKLIRSKLRAYAGGTLP